MENCSSLLSKPILPKLTYSMGDNVNKDNGYTTQKFVPNASFVNNENS